MTTLKPSTVFLVLLGTLALVLLGPHLVQLPPEVLPMLGWILGLPVPALEVLLQVLRRPRLVVPQEVLALGQGPGEPASPAPAAPVLEVPAGPPPPAAAGAGATHAAPGPGATVDVRQTQPSLPALETVEDFRDELLVELVHHWDAYAAAQRPEARLVPRQRILHVVEQLAALPRKAVAAAALLLLMLMGLPGCSPATTAGAQRYAEALLACGASRAPAALADGVSVALHGGEGWREALVGLGARFGGCLLDAEVLRYALPSSSSAPGVVATSSALTTSGTGTMSDLAQARAELWLQERRR